MKKIILLLVIAITTFKFINISEVMAQEVKAEDRIIVRFREFTPKEFEKKIVRLYGAEISEDSKLPRTFIVRSLTSGKKVAIDKLNKDLFVEFAEEDGIAETFIVPNDPAFTNQWGMANINAASGWDTQQGSEQIKIAIVDTGVKYDHPDLRSKISKSVNCINSSCPDYQSTDPNGHGTHVAGIAGAATNNGIGVAGLNWGSKILSVKSLDDRGQGYYSWIINGIVWSADNGADVINLSLGGTLSSSALENAVTYAFDKGAVVVAAAGNSGNQQATYPGYYSKVIAVGATDQNDSKAYFSNYGTWVDVAAPGVSIYSTYKNGYANLSGTSMSTPFVSGLAALVKSQSIGMSNAQIRNRIESTADFSDNWGHGKINVCAALSCEAIVIPTNKPSTTPIPTAIATVELTPSPTNLPTIAPTSVPTSTPIPTKLPSPTPTLFVTPIPTPIQSPKPWFCVYIPWHYMCQ